MQRRVIAVVAVACGSILVAMLALHETGPAPQQVPAPPPVGSPAVPTRDASPTVPAARHAGSAACQPCHEAIHARWAPSHHARAERVPDAADRRAFSTEASGAVVSMDGDTPHIEAETVEGRGRFPVERVLGVAPLWQPLVRLPGGEQQITAVAWDPAKGEWFLAFEAPRPPGEWGHWASRGMRWNIMCADCHNTGVEKGYDPDADTWNTTVAEHGVGCEACHGPSAAHAATPTEPVPVVKPDMETCAPCHSRRAPLVGAIDPGTPLLDGAMLLTVGLDELYYPDGQIRDEVFGYASFRSSVMHENDVTCTTCHDPHGGALRKPGSALCVDCHQARPGFVAHDHHPQGGADCVGCHMPLTTYMQRHPRHDHGFTVPDPALTVSHGIPNACNRCHADQSPAWAAEHVRQWFGDALTPRARRSRALADLHRGDDGGVPEALELTAPGRHPFWRAVAAGMLGPWAGRPAVSARLLALISDSDPLVRAKAIESLAPLARRADVAAALDERRTDPVRAVRVAAQRATRDRFDPDDPAVADLAAYLRFNADQPQAAAEMGAWLLARKRGPAARDWLEKAARWDPASGPVWHALGLARGLAGDVPAAIEAFAAGTRRDPQNPALWFALGAMQRQVGQAEAGRAALERAAALGHPRASALLPR